VPTRRQEEIQVTKFKLNEGGFHGHMSHLYENPELTFKQIKDVFAKAAAGELEGTEKTDGQNLYVSFSIKDDQAKAVRNKGQIKAGGLNAEQLADQYKDHPNPNVKNAFVDTFKTFERVVKNIPDEMKEKFFGPDANIFYNAEVMDPRSSNVIYYDIPTLLIHRAGHTQIDKETGKISPVKSDEFESFAQALSDSLSKAQEKVVDKKFNVQLNALQKLKAMAGGQAVADFSDRLEKEINKYGISDDQTIAEYLAAKLKAGKLADLDIPEHNMVLLVKRLIGELQEDESGAYKNVPVRLIKRGLEKGAAAKVANLVKAQGAIFKEETLPVEKIVHDFAIDILKTLESAFIIDNKKETERLKKEVQKAINIIQASEDPDREIRIDVLEKQLEKLKGVDNIYTATEGFVFDLDGHTYKFTGTFAPVNQILGLFKYGRGKVEALPDLTIGDDVSKGEAEFFYKKPEPEQPYVNEQALEGEEEVAYVFIPGGFKPPHKGHISLIKRASQIAPHTRTVVLSGKEPRDEGDIQVTAEKAEKIFKILLAHEGLELGSGPGQIELSYFDPAPTGIIYKDTPKNRELNRVDKPVMSSSPMLQIGIRAAEELEDGATIKVISSKADENYGKAFDSIINKFSDVSGKKFKTQTLALDTEDIRDGEKISATDMRKAAAADDFETFKTYLADDLPEEKAKEVFDIVRETMEEATGAAGMGMGYSGNVFSKRKPNEESIYNEQLRKIVRSVIMEEKEKMLNEEKQLRNFIRQILTEDDAPTKSTGINKLIDVLKIILPTIESSFKTLTTRAEQRESFKQHYVKSIIDTLAPQDAIRDAAGGESPSMLGGSALEEQEIDVKVEDDEDPIKADPMGIELEPEDDEDKVKIARDGGTVLKDPEGGKTDISFPTIPGLDETGRDQSVDAYKKTIDAVVRSYRTLHNSEDRKEFKEYLITNLLLYFDKFEADISGNLPVITTPEYEKQVATRDQYNKPVSEDIQEAIKKTLRNSILY